jgi:lipopolysaccharide export LptBFGC system permease protein LptF
MLSFNEFVLPRANMAYKTLFFKIVSQRSNVVIRENTYADDMENMVVHVAAKDPSSGLLHDLTIFRYEPDLHHRPQMGLQIITAKSGRLVSDRDKWRVYLDLSDGQIHSNNLNKPAELTQMAFEKGQIDFDLAGGLRQGGGVEKKPQEMTIREMSAELAVAPPQDPRHRKWGVQIHKKIAVAFACLAFAVIAFPLGCSVNKGGRLTGFTWSLGLIFFYYMMLTLGDSQAADGSLPPWLSQWLANFSLMGIGLLLFYFMSRGRTGHAR